MKSTKLVRPLVSAVIEALRPTHDRLFGWMQRNGLVLCAAPTTVQTLAGATLGVSATLPATFDAAGFAATGMVYAEIGEVEDFGDHGLTRSVAKFTPVGTAVVAKRPGAKDYGEMTLKIGNVPSDAGQVICAAAVESNLPIAFKMTYPSGEIHYLSGCVTSFVHNDGSVDNIQRVTVKIDLDRKPVVVAAV